MNPVLAIILIVLAVCAITSIMLRRHGESDTANPDWRRTDEVFNDPSTNRVMRVWLDATGERHYVAEGKSRAS